MAAESATFDIILLFGPDAGNKLDCLPSSFLTENAEIICPDDLYKVNPEYGLRDIALKAVTALKQNKQVVINDELRSRSTRRSLLETIKKKVPSCRVQLVQVIPKYGFMQVIWSLQFSYNRGLPITASKDEEHLRHWFDESMRSIDYTTGFVDKPSPKEGYVLEMLSEPLQVKSHFKLEFPALFFQWEGVLNEKEELNSQVEVLCEHWAAQNPCGRILFICDGKNVARGILSSENELSNLTRILQQLAVKIKHPVYAVTLYTASCSRSFSTPPQPGILAFLQFHHLLNLHSKSTCYIFNDVDHMKMAEATGIRHIKISSVLKSPDMVLKGFGSTPSAPAILRTMVVEKPNTSPLNPTVPLFDCRHAIKDGHVSHVFENGLEEHIFLKDIQSFCHYQEEFARHLTPIDHPGSNFISTCPAEPAEALNAKKVSTADTRSAGDDNSDVNIPHWMRKKRPKLGSEEENQTKHPQKCAGNSSAKNSCRSSKTIYVMSEKEVVEMARQVLLQARREDIITAADQKAQEHSTH